VNDVLCSALAKGPRI